MLLKTSFTSHVLNRLGRAAIGSPKALGLGDRFEDFYFLAGDRAIEKINSPLVLRERITANVFRRLLFTRIAIAASVLSFALCFVGVLGMGATNGVKRLATSSASAADTESCAALSAYATTHPLTDAQRAKVAARCGR